jgi:class 3 adenylate cyclase
VNSEVQYARNGDISLAFTVVGSGPIDVVLVPGFIGNLDLMWEQPSFARLLRRLASFSRLIVMDRRGTGLSDRLSPGDLPPLEVLMDDLRVVLDEVGSDRSALFGYVDGALICALFAATYPERVSALALYGTEAASSADSDFDLAWTDAEWQAYLRDMADGWGTRAYADKVLPWFFPSLAGDEATADWWTRYMRGSASPAAAVMIEEMARQMDVRSILPTIRVPTIVIHRREDATVSIEAGRDVAARIPGARFVELPGADNAPWAGDPDEVLDEVEPFFTGTRSSPRLDRVLATILFTDIVGSTDRATRMGDARWHETLAAHYERSRAQLAVHGGTEIVTTGDGILATFPGPARAVQCACDIAESVRQLGIDIRAGVHTGEIERLEGDIGGAAVHIGARIASLAGAREVLVSSTVKELTVGSGLSFEDAGDHVLKGIPDRWHLYRVVF